MLERLRGYIKEGIRKNNDEDINGALLQGELIYIVDILSKGEFLFEALPTTNPLKDERFVLDKYCFYLAKTEGIYQDFQTGEATTISLVKDDVCFLIWDGKVWRKLTAIPGGYYMVKSDYDADGNGIVDDSEKLGGVLAENYVKSNLSLIGEGTNPSIDNLGGYVGMEMAVISYGGVMYNGTLLQTYDKATKMYRQVFIGVAEDGTPIMLNRIGKDNGSGIKWEAWGGRILGDMSKSDYDENGDGRVNDSDKLEGLPAKNFTQTHLIDLTKSPDCTIDNLGLNSAYMECVTILYSSKSYFGTLWQTCDSSTDLYNQLFLGKTKDNAPIILNRYGKKNAQDTIDWQDWEIFSNGSLTPYILPVATASTLGGVKQGEGVAIAPDGTISATGGGGGGSYIRPTAFSPTLTKSEFITDATIYDALYYKNNGIVTCIFSLTIYNCNLNSQNQASWQLKISGFPYYIDYKEFGLFEVFPRYPVLISRGITGAERYARESDNILFSNCFLSSDDWSAPNVVPNIVLDFTTRDNLKIENGSHFILSVSYATPAPTNVPVTGFDIAEDLVEIPTTGTYQIDFTISPFNATNKAVTWVSSHPSVATVDSNGVVTASDTNTYMTTITGTTADGGYTDSIAVHVKAAIIPVTGFNITEDSADMPTNETASIPYTISPSNATNKAITWISSNPSVATVNSSGIVTSFGIVGTTTITGTTADGGYTDNIIMEVKSVPVTSIDITDTPFNMPTTGTRQIQYVVNPANATNKTVTWTSSNPSVATVDNNGLVTALSVTGTSTITGTTFDGSYSDSVAITVVEGITINGAQSETYNPNGNGNIPWNYTIMSGGKWAINDPLPEWLTLSTSEPGYPAPAGTHVITVNSSYNNGVSRKHIVVFYLVEAPDVACILSVDQQADSNYVDATSLNITENSVDISINEAYQIPYAITPSNATDKNVYFYNESGGRGIAPVSMNKGLLMGRSAGTTTIKAIVRSTQIGAWVEDTMIVNVIDSTVPMTYYFSKLEQKTGLSWELCLKGYESGQSETFIDSHASNGTDLNFTVKEAVNVTVQEIAHTGYEFFYVKWSIPENSTGADRQVKLVLIQDTSGLEITVLDEIQHFKTE